MQPSWVEYPTKHDQSIVDFLNGIHILLDVTMAQFFKYITFLNVSISIYFERAGEWYISLKMFLYKKKKKNSCNSGNFCFSHSKNKNYNFYV